MAKDNPWLGLKSYDENDRIYGRQKESDELSNIIINSFHTIIYGKSGIGKTSLLRAGVFPTLRYEDFMPIYIRLEHKENAEEDYYLRQIEEVVGGADDNCGETHRCASLQDIHGASLHTIFSSIKSIKSRGIGLTPVFVFDQFEEIFTLNENHSSEAVTRFFSDLSDILNNDDTTQNYRIVICLREDYLYYIESLSESIPAFKRNRYRLLDLSRDEALEVITQPQKDLVTTAVADEILRKLSPDNANEVNATILSLYMSQLYDKMVKSSATTISSSLIRQFGDDIISAFYFSSIDGISDHSIEYLEDHLVTTGGYRHNVPLEDALSNGIKQSEINCLKDLRILNIQPRQGNILYMEYTHDVLCPIIVSNREQRTLRKKAKRQKKIFSAWVVFVILLIAIVGGFILQNKHITQERDNMKLMQSRAIAGQAEQLYKENYYGKGVALCLRALPEDLSNPDRPISGEALVTLTKSLYTDFACCKRVMNHGDRLQNASFSPDGKYIITSSNDSTARIWSVETGELVKVLRGHKGYVSDARFSPDGKSVLTCSGDGTMKLWNAVTGKLTKTITQPTYQAKYSEDGHLIISSSFDTVIRIWNAESGKLLKTLRGHKNQIYGFATTHDAKYLVSYSFDYYHFTMIFWDVKSGKQIQAINCGSHNPSIELFPDKHIVATISREESGINIWDIETGRLIKKIGDRKYYSTAISPDGCYICATVENTGHDEGGGAYIYDIETGKEVKYFSKDVYFGDLTYSPDGKYVVAYTYGTEYRKYTILNVETGESVRSFSSQNLSHETAVFSPDGHYVLTVEDDAKLWDMNQNRNFRYVDFHGKELQYFSNIVSPDGKNLLFAMNIGEDTIVIANAVTGEFVRSFSTGLNNPFIQCLSPDAHYVTIYIYEKNAIQYWDTRSGKCVFESEISTSNNVFSPDCHCTAFSLNKKTMVLVNVTQRKQIQEIKVDSGYVDPIAFTSDGKSIIAYFSSDSTIREYDVATGRKVKVYDFCPSIRHATLSSDGKYLATVSENNCLIIWDVAKGKLLNKTVYDANGGGSVSFSPDNRYFVMTGGGNGHSQCAQVFDLKSGKKITELNFIGSSEASFTPDGKNIMTIGWGAAYVWRFFEPQQVIDYFRKVAGDYKFTPEEEIKYYLK